MKTDLVAFLAMILGALLYFGGMAYFVKAKHKSDIHFIETAEKIKGGRS